MAPISNVASLPLRGEPFPAPLVPPGPDGVDRKVGGVGDSGGVDPAVVVSQVVDPIPGSPLAASPSVRSAKLCTPSRSLG
jgi:hypothetical protein